MPCSHERDLALLDLLTASYRFHPKAGVETRVQIWRNGGATLHHVSPRGWFPSAVRVKSAVVQSSLSSLHSLPSHLPHTFPPMFSLAFSAPATLAFFQFCKGPWASSLPGTFSFRPRHGHLPVIHFSASIALPPGRLLHAPSKLPKPATC